MSSYAIFFVYNNVVYRLPVNPEEMNESSVMAIDKYQVLKLGQIAVPTHLELKEYSFECEFPKRSNHYVETSKGFKNADYYIKHFKNWRNKLVPVQFIAGKVNNNELELDGSINTLVLIEQLEITEKAGEEGDKYISFKLLEYRNHSKYKATVGSKQSGNKKLKENDGVNPKLKGYHIVKTGDTLWAIAKSYYGDSTKYIIIYNANRDKIKNPALIQKGWKLRIPDKSEFSKYS